MRYVPLPLFWAGAYRSVNIAKGRFLFAAAPHVPKLMYELERGPLKQYTPCRFMALEDQAKALAVVHCELILNHTLLDWADSLA